MLWEKNRWLKILVCWCLIVMEMEINFGPNSPLLIYCITSILCNIFSSKKNVTCKEYVSKMYMFRCKLSVLGHKISHLILLLMKAEISKPKTQQIWKIGIIYYNFHFSWKGYTWLLPYLPTWLYWNQCFQWTFAKALYMIEGNNL